MSDDEVRDAARRQRERLQAKAAAAKRELDDNNDPNKRTKHRAQMITDALAGKGGERLGMVAILLVLIVVVGGGAVLIKGSWAMWVLPVPALVACIAAYAGTDRALAWFARRELRRVRRGFEAAVYLEQLGDNYRDALVAFTLRFSKPVQRRELEDAIREWMREPLTFAWQGDQLVAKTAEQSCHLWIDGGHGNHEWSNRALHTQTAHFIRRVVPHLGDLAKLDIDLEGDKVAWNKDP